MISKFAGNCKVCGRPYAKGAEIEWSREEGARHPDCLPPEPVDLFAGQPDPEQLALADKLQFRPHEEFKPTAPACTCDPLCMDDCRGECGCKVCGDLYAGRFRESV